MSVYLKLLVLLLVCACQVKTTGPAGIVSGHTNYTTSLTATSNIIADGILSSNITVTITKNNLPAEGETPTLTSSGSNNVFTSCSVSDAAGISLCLFKSTKAEVKSVSVLSPALSASTSVTFLPGTPNSALSTITASGPTIANGTAEASVTITIKDAHANGIPSVTPTFSATDTGATNVYTTCSLTNTLGVSTCYLKSTKAEIKNLSILTPIIKNGGTGIFIGGTPVAANSSIAGTGPVMANGTASSSITITLLDNFNNPSIGYIPTFVGTNTNGSNTYGVCSSSNTSGTSTCTLKSLTAETKTLSIATPVSKSGGSVVFTASAVSSLNSTITASGPIKADGVESLAVTITLKDASNNAVAGMSPTFSATDTGLTNSYEPCSISNASGVSICSMTSTKAESKTLEIKTPIIKSGGVVIFNAGPASVLNTTIVGTSPVSADGSSTSSISISIKDAFDNPISASTPTFIATDTNSKNIYGTCSPTNPAGLSFCTLASTMAEIKTLQLISPVTVSGNSITFSSSVPVAANSTIKGTGPVTANGISFSTITITLKDLNNNPVPDQVPTFGATDSSATNNYGICSASDASGISICSLKSLKAENKTLFINTPISKSDGNVLFISDAATDAFSSITGSGPVIANGSAASIITITLMDSNNNPIEGQTPTFKATDSGINNIYGACSPTSASGVSSCTLSSLKAETKILEILTPVNKSDGLVQFTSGSAISLNSSITGTGPVTADNIATSSITIFLRDSNNNPVEGQTPTFSATDSGTDNTYSTCSVSDFSGKSQCTLSSNTAESKTLNIETPVSKPDGNVVFISGSAVAGNSTITGTGSVVADGIETSTITITLKDISNNPVTGMIPTFSATNTGSNNAYGVCSATNISGISTCTLSSLTAETKTLTIDTPVTKTDGTVIFIPGAAFAANSSITGSGPILANGIASSTVTIILKDANHNFVTGQTPTFSATDTGGSNIYGTCSTSNSSGSSTCSLKSIKAESKTLSIVTPVAKSDGLVLFTPDSPVATNSTITGTGPVVANGTATSSISITLKDQNNNAVAGMSPTFSATDTGSNNSYSACTVTNSSGIATCTLSSLTAESKILSISTPVSKTDGSVVFTAAAASAANSTITGTGPVVANGTAVSTITITLKDSVNNPVVGQVPTFSATDTSSTNTYGACSATNSSGISTCSFKSLKAESKTLSIVTPVAKTDGIVVFTAGSAVAANSTITGTGPATADSTSFSTITITLRDTNNNPVSSIVPTFTATNTGAGNTYGTCTASDNSGVSFCSLKSTKAETKTLSIATPVVKVGGTVVFNAGPPVVAKSDITGTSPVSADGISVSFITISLADNYNNPVVGVTPIFNATDTNSTNAYGACSATNSSGSAACTLSSTRAEVKTLQLTSPIGVTGSSTVTFSSSLPTSINSTITATGPVLADGISDSTVTITLKDGNNNPVAGIVPIFDATDTDSGNVYDACSMSNASGVSICTFSSTKAETKVLRITNPVTKTGGSVSFTAGPAVAANSSISGTGPVVADGIQISNITIILKDINNNFVTGIVPTFSATNTGSGNTQTACSATNSSGSSTCTLKSTKAESKIPQVLTPVSKTGNAISFVAGSASAANSTITGTGPTNPDGTSTSTITITLKDANSNSVAGIIPTFGATGTNNTYGACSSTNSSGISTCTLSSSTGELKTLSILTPVSKSDGTVLFQSGSAVAANSTITGTGPVIADGSSLSTITITLKDSTNASVIGVVPIFTAGGTSNTISTCSSTNTSGVSTCTLKSTKAESKLLEISSPVIKSGNSVQFNPGPPSVTTTTIVASTPTLANGIEECGITVTIKDINNNPISGIVPTYSMSGTNNSTSACNTTNLNGESFCTATSTKAQEKTFNLLTPVTVAGNSVDFNPNGINIQVPIEMTDRGLASNTSIVTFNRSRTSLDTSDYVAQSNNFIFEVIADNINTTTSYTIYLVSNAGVQIPESAIMVPPNTIQQRFSVSWTPNNGADNYRIRLPATAAANQVKVHSAKMIVEQVGAVATKIYIPLAGGDFSGESNNDTTSAIVSSTVSTTFVQPVNSNFYLWTRSDTSYDAIDTGTPWTLETISSISNSSATASVALFDKTTNQQITDATTNVTGTTAVTFKQVSFTGNATNFINGNIFELRMKTNNATYTARLLKAGLWLKLKYLKKSEIYFRLSNRRSASTSVALPDARFYWDVRAWSNPIVYFQTNASLTTSSVSLQDHGTNDVGTSSPTTVGSSTIIPTASYVIQRTGALNLTDSNRYFIQHNRSAGTAVLGGAFLVIQASE
jgi:adhesin/invasin